MASSREQPNQSKSIEAPRSFFERWSASAKEKINSLKGRARAWAAEMLVSKPVEKVLEKSGALAPVSVLANLAELDPDVLFKPKAAQARERFQQTRLKIASEAVKRIDVTMRTQDERLEPLVKQRQALVEQTIIRQARVRSSEAVEQIGQSAERLLADLDTEIVRAKTEQQRTRPYLEDSRQRLKFIIDTESGANRAVREAIESSKNRYELRDAIVKLNKSDIVFLGKTYGRTELQKLNMTILNYIGTGDGSLADIPLTANLRSKAWQLRQEVMRKERLQKEASQQLAESGIPEDLESFARQGPELARIQRSPRQWAVLWKLYSKNGKLTPEQVLEKRAFATGSPMTLEEYETKHLQEQNEKTREGFVDTLTQVLKVGQSSATR